MVGAGGGVSCGEGGTGVGWGSGGCLRGRINPPDEVLAVVRFRAGLHAPNRMGGTFLFSALLSLWAVGLSLGRTLSADSVAWLGGVSVSIG